MIRRAACVALALALFSACEPATEEGPDGGEAARIVTLAPHLAELVYAVGAGEKLVGVSAWSDFPPAVRALPVVGDAFAVDQERLAALRPDLVLAWESGTPQDTIDGLRARGFRVETIRSASLADIEDSLRTVAALAGRRGRGEALAGDFRRRLDNIAAGRSDGGIRFFLQISERPLYTVGAGHYISELLSLCGGRNVFADLPVLSASVDVEAVVARDPEVLVTLGDVETLAHWSRWDGMAAVRNGALLALPPEAAGRPSNRVLLAADVACDYLDGLRGRR